MQTSGRLLTQSVCPMSQSDRSDDKQAISLQYCRVPEPRVTLTAFTKLGIQRLHPCLHTICTETRKQS